MIRDCNAQPELLNILIKGNKIEAISPEWMRADVEHDFSGRLLLPGFVQSHVHLCQTLFRGIADDLSLLEWLKKRIWPLEASHDADSTYWSAMLGCVEMLRGGVTTACVMESVRNANQTAEAIEHSGLRALFGKAMMDFSDTPQELGGVPRAFIETTEESMSESVALMKRWDNSCEGRIRYVFAPRGILTTSEELLHRITALSKKTGVLLHTHACESAAETKLVKERRGNTEIKYLQKMGAFQGKWLLAHGVTADDEDIEILSENHVNLAHCPSTNLKLGSGVAPIAKFIKKGVNVGLASDGAPANNNLDIFTEMRLAALLAKGVSHDPTALPAKDVLNMATQAGANALGLGDTIGSLEPGKRADLVALDLEDSSLVPAPCNAALVVYSGSKNLVRDVMVDGNWIIRNKEFVSVDEAEVREKARISMKRVLDRFERGINI